MEVADIRRQLGREHESLAKAADAAQARIAAQVLEPLPPRRAIAGEMLHRAPGAPHAPRLLMEVFRKIVDWGADLAMNGMGVRIARAPQSDETNVEAALLERAHFLGDKGLGKARIAFEDEGDRGSRALWQAGDQA